MVRIFKKNIGFFIWAVGGYGELFRKYPYPIAAEGEGCHAFALGGNVAQGSRLANQSFMWDIITTEFRRHPIKRVADLGSGNAGALISLCKVFPEATGIGIDVSAKAIDDAQRNILRHGLQDRIRLYNQNVLQAVEDPVLQQRFAQADTLMTFIMMHDLFNIEDPIWVLKKLRSTFPNVREFLIADTFISEEQSLSDESPIFVYGFEYVHSLMKIKLFKKSDYENYFAAAGFNIMATHYLNVPNTYLFVLQ
ncbi:methyltransferase domain-containing protein [Candidatus Sodalis endolongispinus]|uniref:Methyltransferase domain-containing protein n=1 Tax=Candidatus Sodalis endolongispinus TaxID=2812662 RepID=A0ABS5YD11_9GAMM|nr:methyltransferase domain-containing protein [Candidatus Sodalis endolongispinus]MBT9432011.1 methyltransferase domain-containing protein [Candidatus Sodalis endolongispinus]